MARDNDGAFKTFSDFIQRYPDTRSIVETILYREDLTDEQRVEFIMEFIHAETIKRAGEVPGNESRRSASG